MTQIIITKVISRIELIKCIKDIKLCDLKTAKEIVDTISNGIKLPIDVPDEYLNLLKTACEFTTESKRYNMKKHQFKPFDQVLVRNTEEQTWKPNFYSFEGYNSSGHVCTNDMKYAQCIPYNENTAHLLGTTKPYEEPEPKVWYVTDLNAKSTCTMTQKQFEHFMKDVLGSSSVDIAYQIGKIKK